MRCRPTGSGFRNSFVLSLIENARFSVKIGINILSEKNIYIHEIIKYFIPDVEAGLSFYNFRFFGNKQTFSIAVSERKGWILEQ